MTLPRETVVPGMVAEYRRFAELLGTVSDEESLSLTRCHGWTVADVAAHVAGQLTDVTNLQLDGLGSVEVTTRQVDERRGRAVAELVAELEAGTAAIAALMGAIDDEAWSAPVPGGRAGTLGSGVEALLFDTAVHADDVRDALGRASAPGDAVHASLSHIAEILADQGWGPATLELDGVGSVEVNGGGATTVSGDAFGFVLVATGRADPAPYGLDETVNIYR